ncbi:MAG: AAA family ATPase [Alphaproteobacteria bacterium]|nr:AAA family ATPase [Alphaproteobacteria bacterium]
MAEGIQRWLEGLSLDRYVEVFVEHEIDLATLPHLTESDLKELGLPLGPRRVVSAAIAELTKGTPVAGHRQADVSAGKHVEPERRQLTILFCDLVGSTALSQQLDPEDLRDVMRRYQDAVAGSVTRYAGHIAQYLGDGVLAYFGWPQAHEEDAERAVRSGLDAVAAVHAIAIEGVALQARVGIATGQVVIGDIVGELGRDEGAVSGETPNLAARLQAVAGPNEVVIDEVTRRLLGGGFELQDTGLHEIKGMAEPVPAWRVIGEAATESRFEAAHPGTLTRLVGRKHELGLLQERWDHACEGEGQVVLISGEAGIGKSRLIQALSDAVADQPHFRLRYQCSPYHINSALHPIIRQIEAAAGFAAGDSGETRLQKLARLLRPNAEPEDNDLPLLASLLSLPVDASSGQLDLSPQQRKNRTLAALIRQLLRLSGEKPVLFLLEDAHWADPTTQELLEQTVTQISDARVLMLITHRPEWRAPISEQPHVAAIALSGLARNRVKEIVRSLAGLEVSEDFLTQVADRADGIPLFAEELTKSALEEGVDTSGATVDVPDTLQASLLARLDRLGDAKITAQIGAVIGREFRYGLLSAVADMSEGVLNEALGRLVESGLVYQRGAPPTARYQFKHVLIQDAAYESLLRRRRQALHGRIAEVLETESGALPGFEPEVLARHYTQAGLADRAAENWRRAGSTALAQSAYSEALRGFQSGLDLIANLPGGVERNRLELELQVGLGVSLMATKGFAAAEVERTYRRAAELCDELGDSDKTFQVQRGQGQHYMIKGELEKAHNVGMRCLKLAERAGNDSFQLEAHHLLWTTLTYLGRFNEALAHTRNGAEIYDPERHRDHALLYAGHDPGACNHMHQAWLLTLQGRTDAGAEEAAKATILAQQLGHTYSVALATFGRCWVHLMRREPAKAAEWSESLMALAQDNSLPFLLGRALVIQGWIELQRGRLEPAVRHIGEGIQTFKSTGATMGTPQMLMLLGEAQVEAGDTAAAYETLDQAERLALDNHERFCHPEILRLRAELISREMSAAQDAERYFHDAIQEARHSGARLLELRAATSLARFWLNQGKTAKCHHLLAPVHASVTEGLETADLRDAGAVLSELS